MLRSPTRESKFTSRKRCLGTTIGPRTLEVLQKKKHVNGTAARGPSTGTCSLVCSAASTFNVFDDFCYSPSNFLSLGSQNASFLYASPGSQRYSSEIGPLEPKRFQQLFIFATPPERYAHLIFRTVIPNVSEPVFSNDDTLSTPWPIHPPLSRSRLRNIDSPSIFGLAGLFRDRAI